MSSESPAQLLLLLRYRDVLLSLSPAVSRCLSKIKDSHDVSVTAAILRADTRSTRRGVVTITRFDESKSKQSAGDSLNITSLSRAISPKSLRTDSAAIVHNIWECAPIPAGALAEKSASAEFVADYTEKTAPGAPLVDPDQRRGKSILSRSGYYYYKGKSLLLTRAQAEKEILFREYAAAASRTPEMQLARILLELGFDLQIVEFGFKLAPVKISSNEITGFDSETRMTPGVMFGMTLTENADAVLSAEENEKKYMESELQLFFFF
jgi:hypothetical protein